MRIGVVTHYWLPHRGGVEVMASEHASLLASYGHHVKVVTSSVGARCGTSTTAVGAGSLTVMRHGAWDGLGKRGVPVPLPGSALVRAWFRLPHEVDVLIVHGSAYVHSPISVMAARRAGTPVLVVQANPHVDYPQALDLMERAVDRTIARWSLQAADSVVSISRFTANHVNEIAPRLRRHCVIYPGVDETWWRPPSPSEKAGAQKRLRVKSPVALTVRRIVPRNGVDLAVDAWMRCDLDRIGTFLIVGDGPGLPVLQNQARNHNIRFLGSVDDETVRTAYHAADVFVLPTRSGEGFGLAAAQAMATGLPVVTTCGGAQEELVLDGVTGDVVGVDPLELGEAIALYLTDEHGRAAAGAKGRNRVEECFTWMSSTAGLLNELESLSDAAAVR